VKENILKIGEYLAKLQARRTWLSRALVHLANILLKDGESTQDNLVLACNFAKYSPILIFFTRRLSNKPFLMWLLTTQPHLKYIATLPCNLSLMACFADNNVSQGSVATYARCSGIADVHLTANLTRNLKWKNFSNRLRIYRIMVMSLWPHFLAHPVVAWSWTHLDGTPDASHSAWRRLWQLTWLDNAVECSRLQQQQQQQHRRH